MQWCGSILWRYKLCSGVAAYYGVINYVVVWWHTMALYTMQWCGSTLCLYTLCSGEAAHCVVIHYAVVWQHTMSLYTMQWCGSTLCRYTLCSGVAVYYVGRFHPFIVHISYTGGPGSVVGIATGYRLDGRRIESRWRRDFPHLSRTALKPTQPPVKWLPGVSRGKVRPGRDADPSHPSSAEVKDKVELYLYSP
jgi:hypothetical protein